ncbi:MAG: carboxypeptidase-like regulatory domain-containing protein [Bacteroidetes bacterium]|jgi:hypothetical protein|nr:carboxypeptidase-like regulatory domain-containing protein [Bacteroidota bacterium]
MICLYILLFSLLQLGNPGNGSGQIVDGRVYDAESGDSLPSATVLLKGTYRGTITNSEGYFTLNVESLPATVIVRYIGFESQQITVETEDDLPLSIALTPSVTELGEIVVTGEVIERKKIWRQNLNTYRANAYTRQVLGSDTSIVSISESRSLLYWDQGRGYREVQVSRSQTSNLSEDQNFAGVSYLPNFYDDNVDIAGYRMVGITHPDALDYYHFSLLETTQIDSKPVYKIEITPKRERQPTFIGTAWVLGRDYALLEVDLRPNEVVDFPPPVQDFNLSYSQQYSNYGEDAWLPVDMRVQGEVGIGMVGLRFPMFRFRQVSRITDYRVNVALPDSVYEEKNQLVRVDSLADFEGVSVKPIPLTERERDAYQTIDSTLTFEEAFRPEGFLARMIEEDDEDSERGGGILAAAGRVLPNGLGLKARFNRMDGYHLGLSYEWNLNSIDFSGKASYGHSFHSEDQDAILNFKQKLWGPDRSTISLLSGYEYVTTSQYRSAFYTYGMNSLQTLLGSADYYDYYRKGGWFAGIEIENLASDTDLSLTFNFEEHKNFNDPNPFDYSLFSWQDTRRANPVIDPGRVHSLVAGVTVNDHARNFGFNGYNSFRVNMEYASSALGSDFNFRTFEAALTLRQNTFYTRRLFPNTLDIFASAGISAGDLPAQKKFAVDGAMSFFTPFGILKTRRELPYTGEEYWMVYGEHNFTTIPFEILGLHTLVDRGWGMILFGGVGQITSSRTLKEGFYPSNGIHSEAGISLNRIFGILRMDAAFRLDKKGFYVGFSVPKYF